MFKKKSYKRIISVVLAGVLLLSVNPKSVYFVLGNSNTEKNGILFKEDEYSNEREYLKEWFLLNGQGEHNIYNPRLMYSVSDDPAAILFDVDDKGYVVICLYNYDIMEYCFDSKPLIYNDDRIIYNGFVSFYFDKGNEVYDLKEERAIDKKCLSDFFRKMKMEQSKTLQEKSKELSDIKDILSGEAEANDYGSMQINRSIEYGCLSYPLQTWSDSYYMCHVDSAAILLRYCYDHFSPVFLPYYNTSNHSAQGYLCQNGFLTNTRNNSSSVVYGGANYVGVFWGIDYYLSSHMNVSTYSAVYEEYSYATIKDLINNGIPVVTESTNNFPGLEQDEGHAYVVHGYLIGYDGVPRLYVNDTFGSNNVVINGSSIYYSSYPYGMWYIH
ncbi:MAG: hypothetical protein IJL07_09715 [Lachnospiraceae bacterium]|nr:hypothetical protein [Lachnospiraceae bacterium]